MHVCCCVPLSLPGTGRTRGRLKHAPAVFRLRWEAAPRAWFVVQATMNAHHTNNLGGYHGVPPGAGGGTPPQALQPQPSPSHHHPMPSHSHHHAPPPHLMVMDPSTYDFDAPLRHTAPPPPHHHVGLIKHDLLEPPPPHLMVLDASGHYRNPASMNGFYAAAVGGTHGQQDEQGGGGGSASSSSSFLSGQQEYLALTATGPVGGAPAQEHVDGMRPLGMMGGQQHQHQQVGCIFTLSQKGGVVVLYWEGVDYWGRSVR